MKSLSLLGSTGSIGVQTLDVVKKIEDIKVKALVAYHASQKLLNQVREFKPEIVVTFEKPSEEWLKSLPSSSRYVHGEEGIKEAVEIGDIIMNAISGVAGIKPAYLTLKKGKTLLASNKEAVVCLGKIIKENRNRVIPVDSEHNALFQLLSNVKREEVRKIWLTASGGPFYNKPYESFKNASVSEALNHPRWNMGKKITIDSATLFNKGIEMIEAMYLFDFPIDMIDVVIHPQSLVHGIVELNDNSFLMHLSPTDMRIPIMYALTYPERREFPFYRLSLFEMGNLTFLEVDKERFKSIDICREVGRKGGAYIPALLGADEEAVALFLEGKISLPAIADIIERILDKVDFKDPETVDDMLYIIDWARREVRHIFSLSGIR